MLQIEKGISISQEIVQKYETILPYEVIQLWKDFGYGTLLDGYLRIINPEEYQELLNETYFRGKVSIPILTTAFGDIITLEEGEYIGLVQYKKGTFNIITKGFQLFLQNLSDDYFLEVYFQIPQFAEAVEVLGKPGPTECFGYVPLLALGGSEKVENLQVVKIREHIAIIAQLAGKIGM